jgi:SAM-dependent methyltransferase
LVGGVVARYVAVDLVPTSAVDAVADAERLPFGDEVFDLVLCTQVIEYVSRPARVVDEIYRVLRFGAVLILSAPTIFPSDGDQDGWRFLPPALRSLTSRFTEVHIAPEGRTVAGICRTVNVALDLVARPRMVRAALRWTAYPMINLTGLMLDRLSGANDRFAVNYSVFARK